MAEPLEPDPRAPLNAVALRAALDARGCGDWTSFVTAQTGSTNADAASLAAAAVPLVMATDFQATGRGRLDRSWVTPAGSAVLMSVSLRPDVPVSRWGWLPLMAGVAVVRAVAEVTSDSSGIEIPLTLKWPNDVMAGTKGRKLAGILAERVSDGVAVIGIGLNVDQEEQEFPVPTATSLRLEGVAPVVRENLVAAIVHHVQALSARFTSAGGDAQACGLVDDYLGLCDTVGRVVTVSLPSGNDVTGRATGITRDGALEVAGAAGPLVVSAGDVVHVRRC